MPITRTGTARDCEGCCCADGVVVDTVAAATTAMRTTAWRTSDERIRSLEAVSNHDLNTELQCLDAFMSQETTGEKKKEKGDLLVSEKSFSLLLSPVFSFDLDRNGTVAVVD